MVSKGAETFTRLATALVDTAHVLVEVPVDLSIVRALSRVDVQQIPDMPDRIIAATAVSRSVPVISRDAKITLSTLITIWQGATCYARTKKRH